MKVVKWFVSVAAVFTLCCNAAPLTLSRHNVVVPEIGLRLDGFQGLKKVKLPTPKIHYYTKETPGKPKEPCYDPVEVWRSDQIKGIWKNEHVTMTVAALSNPYPVDLIEGQKQNYDITGALYDRWKKSVGKEFKGTQKDFREWVLLLFFLEVKEKFRDVKGANYLMAEYPCVVNSQFNKVFVIQIPDKDNSEFYILWFKFEKPVQDQELSVLRRSLKSLEMYYPSEDFKQDYELGEAKPVKDFEQWSGGTFQWVSGPITNMNEWHYIKSQSGMVVTDVDDEDMYYGVLNWLERSQALFQLFFPYQRKKNDYDVIRLFKSREGLTSYGGYVNYRTTGYWNPNLEEFLLEAREQYGRRRRRNTTYMGKDIRKTIVHESFYQYISTACNSPVFAPWFYLGCAEFIDHARFYADNSFKIKFNKKSSDLFRRLKIELYQGQCDLQKLISLDHETFYHRDTYKVNKRLAWGLMFYLFKGTIVSEKKEYAKIPYIYYKSRLKGMSDKEAGIKAWSGIDMKVFQEDFELFWRTSELINKANKLSLYKLHTKLRK